MNVLTTKGWSDYELLDSGNGLRLERFGKYLISKPDPQAIWKPTLNMSEWRKVNAKFENDKWIINGQFPEKWLVSYNDLVFNARLSPFKHTGIFPEQILNWEYIQKKINKTKIKPKILNLFAYTGIASIIAAKSGAFVTHVDASKSSLNWAKENQLTSKLPHDSIRWILDDALEFVKREQRRNNFYDGIIMDPPVYGHGPNNEIWDFNRSFPKLLDACSKIIVTNPVFVIVNAYALSSSSIMLKNLMEDYFNAKNVEYGELAISQKNNRLLSTGIYSRFSSLA